ncbi:MAG: metal-dependent hydrolase [Turicibacter sp.]|nr:metal-dependent hydrolase [Turicibacter sp.]
MKAMTHQRAGLCTGLVAHAYFISPFLEGANIGSRLFMITLFCLSTTIGALIPDIDSPSSLLGRFFPWLSRFIAKVFKHRTLTHSLLSIFAFLYLLSLRGRLDYGESFYTIVVLGLMVGHISHILLDLLTPQGVLLFFPLPFKVSIGRIKTGALGETLFHRAMLLTTAVYLIYRWL